MTPARKAALQWFHRKGEVWHFEHGGPSSVMVARMIKDGQVHVEIKTYGRRWYSLTDKDRRMLHGDSQ